MLQYILRSMFKNIFWGFEKIYMAKLTFFGPKMVKNAKYFLKKSKIGENR